MPDVTTDSDIEQNIERLEQEIMSWLDVVWQVGTPASTHHWPPAWVMASTPGVEFHGEMRESLSRLQSAFGRDRLGVMAADMLFNPFKWHQHFMSLRSHVWWQRARITAILTACVVEYAPADIVQRIEARLRLILSNPFDRSEMPDSSGFRFPPNYHLYPEVKDCLKLLLGLPPAPDNLDLMRRVLQGGLNYGPLPLPPPLQATEPKMAYDIIQVVMEFYVLLLYLAQHGHLDYELFAQAAVQTPVLMRDLQPRSQDDMSPSIVETANKLLTSFRQRLTDSVTQALTFDNYRTLLYSNVPLKGPEYLMLAAHNHAALGLDKLSIHGYDRMQKPEAAIIKLAQAPFDPLTPEEEAALVDKLREYPADTLRALLPISRSGRSVICSALGWDDVYPLVQMITSLSDQTFNREGSSGQRDMPNGPDTDSGVIDPDAVRAVLAQAGEKRAKEVLKLFRTGAEAVNTCTLIEAVAGWNRGEIENALHKHGQIKIKAYGLLPLENATDEVLERYIALQQVARDGRKYGAQRRISHAAAVQTALINLARVGGYADVNRLEWEMETRIGEQVTPSGRQWQVGEYALEFVVDGIDGALVFNRGGKPLKSVPKAVRASEAYQEAKSVVDRHRKQVSRLRTGVLEPLLMSGETITPDMLEQLLKLPAARALLQTLILRTEDGFFGILENDADRYTLRGLDDETRPLTGSGPLQIAHPYHLFNADVLTAWQREIVRRRIVQPFKQAFRELYLLTPAERQTGTYSNRFAGHNLDGLVAARLFGSRGWRVPGGEYDAPHKLFAGIRAVFSMADFYHFMGEVPITADQIFFQPHPVSSRLWQRKGANQIPLEDVPPLIFSEVMRDADLIVSVAQRSGESLLSNEVFVRRGDLIKALLDDLGLPGVRVDGHFAFVQGKLANYRVHMGSAVIHLDPGNYLCIVPSGWGRNHDQLFLPFADDNDAKASEVISKILLLVNDDKIKDESILRQIRRG